MNPTGPDSDYILLVQPDLYDRASYSTVVTFVTVTVTVVDQICWMEKEQTDFLLTCTTGIQSSHYESGM